MDSSDNLSINPLVRNEDVQPELARQWKVVQ